MYEFKKLGGNLAAFYKFNGELPVFNIGETGSLSQRFTEPYHMVDIAATKYLRQKRIHWTLGLKNLLDVQNITSTGTAGSIHNFETGIVPVSWGRTVFTTIKFNIGWK